MGIFGIVAKGVCKPFVKSSTKTPSIKHLIKDANEIYQLKPPKVRQRLTYRIKPDITMPVNPSTLNASNPTIAIDGSLIKQAKQLEDLNINHCVPYCDNGLEIIKAASIHQDELGNVAIRLSEEFSKKLPKARKEISEIFEGYTIQTRAKGANSVYSKLENKISKKGITLTTDAQAREIITDAIGGRVIMPNLKPKDFTATLDTMKIDGRALTVDEKNIITKYFKGEKLTSKDLKLVNKYKRRVKLALAERQSQPIVNKILASSLQASIDSGKITLKQIKESGKISDEIIKQLETGKVKPLEITELNNYVGKDGIPYFTDKQIFEIQEMQLLTKKVFPINSRPELQRMYPKTMDTNAQKAIKESGYTTSQMTVKLKDGTLAEIQMRGTGPFGEIEHIAYDARQGKNTLSSVYDDYKDVVRSLSKDQYKRYNKYLAECYNYHRNLELGLPAIKPKLPEGFKKILSEDSMKYLHDLDDQIQKDQLKRFRAGIEEKSIEIVA